MSAITGTKRTAAANADAAQRRKSTSSASVVVMKSTTVGIAVADVWGDPYLT
ncbi:hypothetical protein ACFLZO_00760 [Patescibacteria group bacterium]